MTVSLIGGPFEPEAVDQLNSISSKPDCCAAAGLPDLHPGSGIPIGAVFGFQKTLLPELVGTDAGCGVRIDVFEKLKFRQDRLYSRAEGLVGLSVGDDQLLQRVWCHGPRALLGAGLGAAVEVLADAEPMLPALASVPPDLSGRIFGAIGGGNHFSELCRISEVIDPMQASRLGIKRGGHVAMSHSGSRSVGAWLAKRWAGQQLSGDDITAYLAELAGAVRVAKANRLVLNAQMLQAAGAVRRVKGSLDLVHNTVVRRKGQWVHRKGAAPGEDNELTVVLGSRGTTSHLMVGQGCELSMGSVAHGAGRRLNRAEARSRIKDQYQRKSLTHTKLGGRVLCPDTHLLREEHPDAYKAIGPVIDALTSHDVAQQVATLVPVLTVKR